MEMKRKPVNVSSISGAVVPASGRVSATGVGDG